MKILYLTGIWTDDLPIYTPNDARTLRPTLSTTYRKRVSKWYNNQIWPKMYMFSIYTAILVGNRQTCIKFVETHKQDDCVKLVNKH